MGKEIPPRERRGRLKLDYRFYDSGPGTARRFVTTDAALLQDGSARSLAECPGGAKANRNAERALIRRGTS